MSDKKPKKLKKTRTGRILRRILLACALALALSAAAMLALPALISSNWARGQAEQQLAKAAGKPVSIGGLSFSWVHGLRLQALLIGQGQLEDENFLAEIGDAHVDFSLLSALRKDTRLVVELRGLRLRLPHSEPAPEPPAKPLSEALRGLFAALRNTLGPPRPLDFDAHVKIDLADMAVRLEPASGGKALELRNASFKAEVQGLKAAPLTIEAALDVFADGKAQAPVRLSASLDGLADASGRLNPAQARLDARLTAPGLELTAGGSLAKTLKIDLRARPGELLDALRPLAASPLPETSGALALALTVSQPDPERLDFGLVFFVDALRAAHGPLGEKSVGPISLSLLQEAALNLKAETARLPGQLDIAPGSQIRWQAELAGVADGKPRATLSVAPLHLALGELLPAVRAYLPPGLNPGQPNLDIASIDLAATLPDKGRPALQAGLKALDFTAANLGRREAASTLSIGRAKLRVDSASLNLSDAAPGRAEASLSATVDGVRLDGKAPLAMRQFTLPRVVLRVDELAQDVQGLFGLTGKAALELETQAKDIEAKGKAALPALTGSTRLLATLPAAKSIVINLEALNLDAPLVRMQQPGKKPLETPLTLRASAPDITLSGPGLTPALRGLRLDLDLGRALRCEALASLDGPAGRDLHTEGKLTLDAQNMLALASAFAPRQAKAAGGLALDWKLSATLPAPQPATPPGGKGKSAPPKKLSQTLKELSFVHEAEALLRLDGLSLDWPLAAAQGQPAETVRLRGLSTPRPLRLSVRDGVGEASLAGSLAFGPMDALPGVGRLTKPLRGLLTVNAAQQGARSVQFSQVLHLDGLELDQNLSLMLDKLDTVLDRDTDRLAAVLERVDASMSFNLTTGVGVLPASASGKGLSGKGRIEAGAEARLTGGRSLALSARLLSPGMDLRLGPDMAVNGFSSSLRFSRSYSLSPGLRCGGDAETALAPLSEQVFDLYPTQSATVRSAPAGEALGQLLRADTARTAGGAFGLAQLKLRSSGLPLDIRDVQARLDDSGPVPGLRSFRAGLLDGNILGSAMLRKNAGRYTLDADLAFTGIDPGRLLPDKTPRDLGAQAETAGRVSLSVPLTPDPEELLQRLTFRADITKIGPRTLERMLYALDPDEQNETIVQQRRLMGMGYPRFLRVAAAYGNLSLSGAVDVKGFQLDLPPVDRLAIANLPLKKQLAKPLAAVPGLIKLLDAASGSRICLDPTAGTGALRIIEQPGR